MIESPPYEEKIHAYLSGNLADHERRSFEAWVAASAENRQVFETAKLVWINSGLKLSLKKDETESHWQDFQHRLKQQPVLSLLATTWFKAAASITLLAGVAYTLFFISTHRPYRTITAAGEVVSLYLPDSTQVWLNVGSSLEYDEAFGNKNRNVQLHGEGYFNVKHDEANPFTVNTAEVRVHVVGTSFNIKEDSSGVIVLNVAEGKVKFAAHEDDDGMLVERNEEARSRPGESLVKTKVTNRNFSAWRKVNNAAYTAEKKTPAKFIDVKFSWHKNAINQSTIKGTLLNKASLATYQNVVLKITNVNAKGKPQIKYVKLSEKLAAGHTLAFQKRLLDIFTDTQHIQVEVERAEIVQ